MNILVITNYYPPYFVGGYELACKESCDYLISKGHNIYILTGDYTQETKGGIVKNVPYRKLKYIDYSNSSFIQKDRVERFNYKTTKDIIDSLTLDLVYIWNQKAISIAPTIAVQDSNIKHIFEIGDFWMDAYYRDDIKAKINRTLKDILPFTIGGSIEFNPVITVSKWTANKMSSKYNSKDIYIVPNGIEIKEPIKKSKSSKVRLMYASRVVESKGLDILINAVAIYNEKDSSKDLELHIYGGSDKSYLDYCINLANSKLKEGSFFFYGHQNGIEQFFKSSDIFVMPFRATETFGLVVIESMLNMTPVIATDAYGPAEIIDDEVDGLLFDMNSSVDLANKIDMLISNSELYSKIQKNGYIKVCEKYDKKDIKARVENILVELSKS